MLLQVKGKFIRRPGVPLIEQTLYSNVGLTTVMAPPRHSPYS